MTLHSDEEWLCGSTRKVPYRLDKVWRCSLPWKHAGRHKRYRGGVVGGTLIAAWNKTHLIYGVPNKTI